MTKNIIEKQIEFEKKINELFKKDVKETLLTKSDVPSNEYMRMITLNMLSGFINCDSDIVEDRVYAIVKDLKDGGFDLLKAMKKLDYKTILHQLVLYYLKTLSGNKEIKLPKPFLNRKDVMFDLKDLGNSIYEIEFITFKNVPKIRTYGFKNNFIKLEEPSETSLEVILKVWENFDSCTFVYSNRVLIIKINDDGTVEAFNKNLNTEENVILKCKFFDNIEKRVKKQRIDLGKINLLSLTNKNTIIPIVEDLRRRNIIKIKVEIPKGYSDFSNVLSKKFNAILSGKTKKKPQRLLECLYYPDRD